jgi:phosphatidylinositol-3-phosphatase
MSVQRTLATFAAGAVLVAAISACGGDRNAPDPTVQGGARPSSSPSATAALPSATPPRPTVAELPHVFVIVMENTGLSRALGSRPIARLADTNMLATNYYAVARPSLPNYLAMTSGSTWDITDNEYHVLPTADLGTQLTTAGTWRA